MWRCILLYKILRKERLNDAVSLIEVEAPYIAKKAEPGQFIILRIDEEGERVPFTIADYDREKGTVTVIFQIVGMTTERLNELNEGDYLLDFVGPLGKASEFEGVKNVAVIGGGLGTAIAYPQAKKLNSMGVRVDMINGFRNKDIIIIEDECRAACGHEARRCFCKYRPGRDCGYPGTGKCFETEPSGRCRAGCV